MKQKILKAWALILPGTNEPYTDLGLDNKNLFGRCRRFILPETKSGAQAIIKINGLHGLGYKVVSCKISFKY